MKTTVAAAVPHTLPRHADLFADLDPQELACTLANDHELQPAVLTDDGKKSELWFVVVGRKYPRGHMPITTDGNRFVPRNHGELLSADVRHEIPRIGNRYDFSFEFSAQPTFSVLSKPDEKIVPLG